jgi:hypothetical protein
MKKRVLLQLMLVITVALGTVGGAAAQWTSVGSAGTVDEADIAKYETSGSAVRIIDTVPTPASVVIRYNVVAVAGLSGGDGIVLNARYRDNGSGARVLAVLRQINIETGVTTTVLTLDSNTLEQSSDFQTRFVAACKTVLDFLSNAYFIEMTLSKSSAGGRPGLQVLQVAAADCLPM